MSRVSHAPSVRPTFCVCTYLRHAPLAEAGQTRSIVDKDPIKTVMSTHDGF